MTAPLALLALGEGVPLDWGVLSEHEAAEVLSALVQRLRRFVDEQDPCSVLPLSVRAMNILRRNGLLTVRDVRDCSPSHVARLAHCGAMTRQEVRTLFADHFALALPAWEEAAVCGRPRLLCHGDSSTKGGP